MTLPQLILLILSLWAFTTQAYYVTLDDNELDPSRGKKILTMFLVNDVNSPVAIELTPKKRELTLEGNEKLEDTSHIIVMPPQVILPPNSEQLVSIRWAEDMLVKKEKAYRVIVDELNIGIPQEENTKMIRTKLRFIKSVYVLPSEIKKKLTLTKVYRKVIDDTTSHMVFELANTGTVHTIFSNIMLEYNTGDNKIAQHFISAKDVEPKKSSINILPDRSIQGWIPWPETIHPDIERFVIQSFNVEPPEEKTENGAQKNNTTKSKVSWE